MEGKSVLRFRYNCCELSYTKYRPVVELFIIMLWETISDLELSAESGVGAVRFYAVAASTCDSVLDHFGLAWIDFNRKALASLLLGFHDIDAVAFPNINFEGASPCCVIIPNTEEKVATKIVEEVAEVLLWDISVLWKHSR